MLLASTPAFTQTSAEKARKVVAKVAPEYPEVARSMGVEGSVKADVLVAPNGSPRTVAFKGGHPVLIQAAQNALRSWKWEPAAHETHELIELKFAR